MKKAFGPFTFDSATRELRREGEIVKLQSQPAQVLAVLVEHAGEIVTRDALRQAVWGDETFVDFDKGLNFAVAQVRAALGDSAEAPTYIRTFPKRGYQFVAPSETEENTWRRASVLRDRRSKILRRGPAAALVVALIAIGSWAWYARRTALPARTIAVVRFDNETGVADYDRFAQNVTDALVAELTASGTGRFSIIGNAAELRLPRSQRNIVAIGGALKAGYIVIGQVQRDGPGVRVLAHLIRLPEQTHLWVTRIEKAAEDPSTTPIGVARRISSEFLGKL